VNCFGGCDRSTGATWRRQVRVFVDGGSGGCGQADGQAGSEAAASQVEAKYRRERVDRDRRLERLAVKVLTALGERDAMIAATDNAQVLLFKR
jgi:hypothetical protein